MDPEVLLDPPGVARRPALDDDVVAGLDADHLPRRQEDAGAEAGAHGRAPGVGLEGGGGELGLHEPLEGQARHDRDVDVVVVDLLALPGHLGVDGGDLDAGREAGQVAVGLGDLAVGRAVQLAVGAGLEAPPQPELDLPAQALGEVPTEGELGLGGRGVGIEGHQARRHAHLALALLGVEHLLHDVHLALLEHTEVQRRRERGVVLGQGRSAQQGGRGRAQQQGTEHGGHSSSKGRVRGMPPRGS